MKSKIVIGAAVAVSCLVLAQGPASATSSRTFVSGNGTDSGACSVTAPCRSFQFAYSQTAVGGEIVVLNSAGYGQVAIGHSITITNPGGVEAGISAPSGGDAITISASSPTVVTLRGLTLEGGGGAANGVHQASSSSGTLNVIDCIAKDFANDGILVVTNNSSSNPMNVNVTNSYALNNGLAGIQLTAQNGSLLQYSIAGATSQGNATGIEVDAGGLVVGNIAETNADNNSAAGLSFPSSGYNQQTFIRHTHAVSYSNTIPGILVGTGNIHILDRSFFLFVNNNGNTYSDKTNNIYEVSGNALQQDSVQ